MYIMLGIFGILNDVGKAIMDGLRTLMLTLCDVVYKMIYLTFNIFEKLGTAQIIEDTQIQAIFNRIGLIIGIFMLFRLTFAFIQYIIDPDAMLDKKKGVGNIIAKIIIAIVLLGSTSTLFKFAFTLQEKIIDSHVISNIIFGNPQQETDDFGGELSANLFTAFYRLNENADTDGNDCETYFKATGDENDAPLIRTLIIAEHGELDAAYSCITERDNDDEYIVLFDGGGSIALIAGLFVLYTVMIFTIQVGVRVLQLAYLQIISPIPIMMYITPKGDEQLKKWGQQCLATFLDFFIRVAIIYFAIFVIQTIWDNGTIGKILTAGTESASGWETAYVGVIMIIAVLTFAKKVPNLIKEIFPSLGGAAGFDYGLSFKKQVVEPLKTAYNSPLGWGLKLGGKGIAAIDRKRYGLPKPRGKLGQAVDKWLPGQAEARQNRNKAIIEAKQREEKLKRGESLNTEYPSGDDLVAAFKNKEYKDSYINLRKAKKENGAAEQELEVVRSELNRAVASGNKEAIEIAKERLKTANDNLHSAQGNLELAKTRHESNKKIYTKDAEIEGAYKYYADTHAEHKEYERDMPDLSGQSQQEQMNETLQEILRSQQSRSNQTSQSSGTTTGSTIIIPDTQTSQPRQETTSQEAIQDEHSRLVDQYNNETDPSKKAAIRKQIDDFERRH